MMVVFLQDYIGRETAMRQFHKGEEIRLDQQPAIELIRFGIVEEVSETPKQSKVKHDKNTQ
jgi:hypothetical protein